MSLRIPAGGLVISLDGSETPPVKFEVVPTDEELAKRWAKNRTARTTRICETLIRAFKVTHPGRAVLREDLREVFKFRDYAVHPPERFREPIMHPDLCVGVE